MSEHNYNHIAPTTLGLENESVEHFQGIHTTTSHIEYVEETIHLNGWTSRLHSNMDPEAPIFVPISALNAPPTPRFERNFNEFRSGISTMQDIAIRITRNDDRRSLHDQAQDWDRFRGLQTRLLFLSQSLTASVQSAYFADSFTGEELWIHGAITELMVLCHRYSWITIQLISHCEQVNDEVEPEQENSVESW